MKASALLALVITIAMGVLLIKAVDIAITLWGAR